MELNTTASVAGPIGSVTAINIARAGEPVQLRYFGRAASGATGQARLTRAEAEADVANWHAGKPVAYEKHAELPVGSAARLAAMFSAGVESERQRGFFGRFFGRLFTF